MGWRAHADAVFLVGTDRRHAVPFFPALREMLSAGSLATVSLGEIAFRRWFEAVFRNFAHDWPLDVALQYHPEEPDLARAVQVILEAPRASLEALRPTRRAASMIRRIDRAVEPYIVPSLSSLLAFSQISAGEPLSPERLEMSLAALGWDSELRGASMVAEVGRESAPMFAVEPRECPEARFVEARVMHSGRVERGALTAGRTYAIDVRIGQGEDAESLTLGEPFPEPVAATDEGHDLTVIFTEPLDAPEPQIAHILLPARGPSDRCRFMLTPSGAWPTVEARVTILHRNRVLQTALLRAEVARPSAPATHDARISLQLESAPRPGFADLAGRRAYDLAFVFNKNLDGQSRALAARKDTAVIVAFDWKTILSPIDQPLAELAALKTGVVGPGETALRELAELGYILYENVIAKCVRGVRATDISHVQIVTAVGDERFPLELVYDRPPPVAGAPLCPNAEAALRGHGGCGGCPPAGTVVCPLGFWGLSKVIERYEHQPEDMLELGAAPAWLLPGPHAQITEVDPLLSIQVGASERVAMTDRDDLVLKLTGLADHGLQLATSWEEWRTMAAAAPPSLAILLAHASAPVGHVESLEISRDTIRLAHINHGLTGGAANRPVVLLLACEAGAQHTSVLSAVSRLLMAGAAMVLATSVPIWGDQAADVAHRLVEKFHQRHAESVPMGEFLRAVRRDLMLDCPMVLSLFAFGDADWRFAHRT
jgi:hypothetical protein